MPKLVNLSLLWTDMQCEKSYNAIFDSIACSRIAAKSKTIAVATLRTAMRIVKSISPDPYNFSIFLLQPDQAKLSWFSKTIPFA